VYFADLRPLQGSIKAETAINFLSVSEGRLSRLSDEYDLVCRAKEALDLEQTKNDRLQPVVEELRDLRAVWTALSGIWARLGQLRDTMWSSVQVRCCETTAETSLEKSDRSWTLFSCPPGTCLVECGNMQLLSMFRTPFARCSRRIP
jgi:hypothetical protein